MNAITFLQEQHSKVKGLFAEIGATASADERKRLADDLADLVSIHSAVEERHFYPRLLTGATQDRIRESVEEHLGAKRLLADLMRSDPRDPQYPAKITVLEKEIAQHVREEEEMLFKQAETLLAPQDLETLGNAMMAMAQELRGKGSPRDSIPFETAAPAPLPPVAPQEGAGKAAPHS